MIKRGGHQANGAASMPVGVWIRVSTEDQAQGESPGHHEHRARMYAESRGWEVVRVYDLSGVSGKTVMEHPEAKQMLEDVAGGRIKGLVFSKLARLARNTAELLRFAEYFEKHDANLISLAESIDTSSPAGRLFYTIIAAVGQWEREELVDRVKASVLTRAKLGKPLGGTAPYGYRWEHGQLRVNPEEAAVRVRVFELFAELERLKTVAARLNEAGYRTRGGAKFSDTMVRRLITDPVAKGMRRSNYTRNRGDGNWDLKSPDEWIFTPVEPIVSEELWDHCNGLITVRAEGRTPTKRAVHLFTGVVFCECGGKMTVPSNLPKYRCSKCGRKMRTDDLENVFREELQRFFLSDADVRGLIEQADATLIEKRELLAALKAEVGRVQEDMDQTYRLYLDGVISSQGFGERYKPLEERRNQIREELPRVQNEADFLATQLSSGEEIVTQARDLYGRWGSLSFEEKRRIVETLVERITIEPETVCIDLLYSPVFPSNAVEGQHHSRRSWRSPRARARP